MPLHSNERDFAHLTDQTSTGNDALTYVATPGEIRDERRKQLADQAARLDDEIATIDQRIEQLETETRDWTETRRTLFEFKVALGEALEPKTGANVVARPSRG